MGTTEDSHIHTHNKEEALMILVRCYKLTCFCKLYSDELCLFFSLHCWLMTGTFCVSRTRKLITNLVTAQSLPRLRPMNRIYQP